jgi:hypothetical protein
MKDSISAKNGHIEKTESEHILDSEDPALNINLQLRQFLHDFQQPLTVILATSQLMQLRNLDDTTSTDVDIIFNAATQLEEITVQMREYIHKNVA